MNKLIVKNFSLVSILLIVSAVLRFVFYKSLSGQFTEVKTSNLVVAFVHGLRFDLSALLYLNVLFFLFIFFKEVRASKFVAVLFSIVNSIYVALNWADIDYYLAYGKKLDPSFFTAVKGTGGGIFLSMLRVYGAVVVVVFISLIFFYFLYKSIFFKYEKNIPIKLYPVYFFVVLICSFLSVRGGLQKRVLGKQHTMLYAKGNTAVAHMTSNTVHNLIRSKKGHHFPKEFKVDSLVSNGFDNLDVSPLKLNKKPRNVLFIFIESLSTYPVEHKGLLAYKKTKASVHNDVIYTDSLYANGRLSLDAITASFFGMPSYFNLHLFSSKYVQNKWIGLSTVLKKKDYESFFIHGATEGTQFFDVITKASGIEDFYSVKDRYKAPKGMSALWGVHDDFLYQKAKEIVKAYKKPFVGALFTTSSHIPFKGTPNNRDGVGDVEKDYFLSLEYADQSLERFFESVKNESWFKDTLFIVTGDHSPPILTKWNMSAGYDSRLPLVLYFPESNIGDLPYRKVTQHIDLPATIFHMLDFKPKAWSPFGQSIFDTREPRDVFYTGSGKRGLNVIDSEGVFKSKSFNEDLLNDSDFSQATESIKEYIYRLEKDDIYTK